MDVFVNTVRVYTGSLIWDKNEKSHVRHGYVRAEASFGRHHFPEWREIYRRGYRERIGTDLYQVGVITG